MATIDDLPVHVFNAAVAADAGLGARELRRLRESGAIDRIGRGLYRRADLPPANLDLIEIAARRADATLCLASALAHHGLIDAIPARIDIALPRGARFPRTEAPVAWHHFDAETFTLGRTELPIDGTDGTIGLYSPERSIVDAYRLRGLEGYEIAPEALKNWLRKSGSHPASLMAIAQQLPRASGPLRQALELLS
jgi:predicted transcriptional regulator of viral defense system